MLFLCFLLLLPAQETPYFIVLKNKKIMKAKEAPKCEGRLCTVVLPDGTTSSLPAKIIDLEESERYNVEFAKKQAADRMRYEKEQARLEAEARAKENEENNKLIALSRRQRLPEYGRGSNALRGVPNNESAPEAKQVGDPIVKTYTSSDPVFIARETAIRYEDRYVIECEIKTNLANGAQKIVVTMTANFTEGTPVEVRGTAKDIAYGQSSVVTFEANTTGELLRASYGISYETIGSE